MDASKIVNPLDDAAQAREGHQHKPIRQTCDRVSKPNGYSSLNLQVANYQDHPLREAAQIAKQI